MLLPVVSCFIEQEMYYYYVVKFTNLRWHDEWSDVIFIS